MIYVWAIVTVQGELLTTNGTADCTGRLISKAPADHDETGGADRASTAIVELATRVFPFSGAFLRPAGKGAFFGAVPPLPSARDGHAAPFDPALFRPRCEIQDAHSSGGRRRCATAPGARAIPPGRWPPPGTGTGRAGPRPDDGAGVATPKPGFSLLSGPHR